MILDCGDDPTVQRNALRPRRSPGYERYFRCLILGGHLDVVDDEGFDWALGGLELEAELLLHGGEEGGRGVGREVGGVIARPL